MSFQFSLVYLSNSIAKLCSEDWLFGRAVYIVFSLPKNLLVQAPQIFTDPTISKYFTFSTIFLEGLLGAVILIRKLNIFFLGLAIGFHALLGFFMALNPWHEIFICCLVFIYFFQKLDEAKEASQESIVVRK